MVTENNSDRGLPQVRILLSMTFISIYCQGKAHYGGAPFNPIIDAYLLCFSPTTPFQSICYHLFHRTNHPFWRITINYIPEKHKYAVKCFLKKASYLYSKTMDIMLILDCSKTIDVQVEVILQGWRASFYNKHLRFRIIWMIFLPKLTAFSNHHISTMGAIDIPWRDDGKTLLTWILTPFPSFLKPAYPSTKVLILVSIFVNDRKWKNAAFPSLKKNHISFQLLVTV